MKTIIILSGGGDSGTLLHDLVNQGHEVKALSFNYGQKHVKELDFASKMCKKLGVEHKIIDLGIIIPLISNSALTNKNIQVPLGHYEDPSMKITVVPNRNMIMLSIAIGYAENLNYNCVSIANHKGDRSQYPDCRYEYIQALNLASFLGTYNNIKIHAPYTELTKTDIFEIGLELGIDYDKETWSCYQGGEKPCEGPIKCGTCTERDEALEGAKKRIQYCDCDANEGHNAGTLPSGKDLIICNKCKKEMKI
jgi:7-cyano-7-deazaguanine synthase